MEVSRNILFENRIDAGQKLAEKLLNYKKQNVLVLALPRGGVPVGFEVAKRLSVPLDTLVVRKIGAPFNPEFGVGAVAPGDVIIFDNVALASLGITKDDLDAVVREELQEMERRMVRYKSGAYSADLSADTIIIVDDGLATGVSARAAIASAKIHEKPREIVFASPICARDSAAMLRSVVDEVVCVAEVDDLVAIGYWYQHFPQVSDDEVVDYLEKAAKTAVVR